MANNRTEEWLRYVANRDELLAYIDYLETKTERLEDKLEDIRAFSAEVMLRSAV